ncbi:hypothetical protein ACEPPZ_20685, partial [Paracoccus yeei]
MQNFFSNAAEFLPILAVGIKNTLIVTAGSLLLSTALGLFWAILRLSGNAVVRGLGGSCRECGGSCRAAGSGHVTMAPVRPRGQGTLAREAGTEFPSHRPFASGSDR